jgi:hypothetical protein
MSATVLLKHSHGADSPPDTLCRAAIVILLQ